MEENLNTEQHFLTESQIDILKKYNFDMSDAWLSYTFPSGRTVYTYTVEDILKHIPHIINSLDDELTFEFEMWKTENKEDNKIYWILAFVPTADCVDEDVMELNYETSISLIQAAFDMLIWCIKNNFSI